EIDPVHCTFFAEWKNVFRAGAWQPALHQARCTLGNNDFFVGRNVVAMRVRNESELLCIPRVEPQILMRQVNPALITNFNHESEIYFRISVSSKKAAEQAKT